MSGLSDKAKEAAETAKEKAGDLAETVKEKAADVLDKIEDKAEELSHKEGIVGKVAGAIDKRLDKVTGGDDDASAASDAGAGGDVGSDIGVGSDTGVPGDTGLRASDPGTGGDDESPPARPPLS